MSSDQDQSELARSRSSRRFGTGVGADGAVRSMTDDVLITDAGDTVGANLAGSTSRSNESMAKVLSSSGVCSKSPQSLGVSESDACAIESESADSMLANDDRAEFRIDMLEVRGIWTNALEFDAVTRATAGLFARKLAFFGFSHDRLQQSQQKALSSQK